MRYHHEVVIFERSSSFGGVWAQTYPQVRLQNTAEHYHICDFPWPFPPDEHPTGEQIQRYLQAVVDDFGPDIRLQHEITALREQDGGWLVEGRTPHGPISERFDYAVVASGQFTQDKPQLALPGQERFAGAVLTERDIRDLDILANKDIVIVGFGKTAVDMASFAAERGARVHHVFRDPRWLLPRRIMGLHFKHFLFNRMSTLMIPSWVHPTPAERFLHERMQPVVSSFWQMVSFVLRMQAGLHGFYRDPEVRRRLELLVPEQSIAFQMRSALAVLPEPYIPAVVQGRILPYRAELAGFDESGVELDDGRTIACDMVMLAVGSKSPQYPYLPQHYQDLLGHEEDGVQLYRHILHPRIPRIAFPGCNHSFLHVPTIMVSMLWLCAQLRDEIELPEPAQMEASIERIRDWKRANALFEPTRSSAVSTRFHQYLDVLLGDLGVRPYRKSNPLAELLVAYTAGDYGGVFDEYDRVRKHRAGVNRPLPLDT